MWAITEILVGAVMTRGGREPVDPRCLALSRYEMRVNAASCSLVIAGDSVAGGLNRAWLARAFYGGDVDEVLQLNVGGATPRTLLKLLQEDGGAAIKRRGTLVLVITPLGLNRNTASFDATVRCCLDWGDVACELLPRGRWDDVRLFLSEAATPILRSRQEITDHVRRTLVQSAGNAPPENLARRDIPPPVEAKIDRDTRRRAVATRASLDLDVLELPVHDFGDTVDESATRRTIHMWTSSLCRDWTLDDYQLTSVRRLHELALQRSARLVLVLPPMSSALEAALGPRIVSATQTAVHDLGRELESQVLDFQSNPVAAELHFRDGVHLTSRSLRRWTKETVCRLAPSVVGELR